MADYSGWNAAANGRNRFQSWQRIANDGSVINDGWNRSGFLKESHVRGDHVCRPVVVGADGRTMPVEPDCPPVRPKDGRFDTREGAFVGIFQRAKDTNDVMSSYRVVESDPPLVTAGGWTRPSRGGWELPPSEPLNKVTNEIGAAAKYVRESARPTSVATIGGDQWSSASPPMHEARRRGPTIDSREAAKRYGGQFIW